MGADPEVTLTWGFTNSTSADLPSWLGLVLLDLMVADNGPEREGSNNALVCFRRGIVSEYFVSDCFNIEG